MSDLATIPPPAPEPQQVCGLRGDTTWPFDTLLVRPGDAPKVRELLNRYGLEGQYEVHESPYLPDGTAVLAYSRARKVAGARASDPGTA